MATNVIEKEAVSFQTASGAGTGAGATSQSNAVQGTATTRQTLLNDRQLVGRATPKQCCKAWVSRFRAAQAQLSGRTAAR